MSLPYEINFVQQWHLSTGLFDFLLLHIYIYSKCIFVPILTSFVQTIATTRALAGNKLRKPAYQGYFEGHGQKSPIRQQLRAWEASNDAISSSQLTLDNPAPDRVNNALTRLIFSHGYSLDHDDSDMARPLADGDDVFLPAAVAAAPSAGDLVEVR